MPFTTAPANFPCTAALSLSRTSSLIAQRHQHINLRNNAVLLILYRPTKKISSHQMKYCFHHLICVRFKKGVGLVILLQ